MNILSIICQPYILSILISLLITLIAYFIIKNNNSEEESEKINIPKTLLYTFVISVIIVFLGIYCIDYMNKNSSVVNSKKN